jgi:leader peptidase (prepilin peptidase)/N-methyltransferase
VSVWRFGLHAETLVDAGFCCVLVVLAFIDIEQRRLPNRIVLPAAAAALAAQTALRPSPEWALAALAAAGLLLAAALVYPPGLGMGDVKLALLLGAMLGRTVSVALVVGLLATALPGAALLVRHGPKARRMTVPLAPFLAFGAFVALFAGSAVVRGGP